MTQNNVYSLAWEILGLDLITPEEVMAACFNINYTPEQITHFQETLPPDDELRLLAANGFILVPGPDKPTTMMSHDPVGVSMAPWHPLNVDKIGADWIKLRKEPAADSCSKTWDEQCQLLGGGEHVPKLIEVVWSICRYWKVRATHLLTTGLIRTSSLGNEQYHYAVGYYGQSEYHPPDLAKEMFESFSLWDHERRSDCGLAVARK